MAELRVFAEDLAISHFLSSTSSFVVDDLVVGCLMYYFV
jgi:hypothetical protein